MSEELGEALANVKVAAVKLDEAKEFLDLMVRNAKDKGATWADIGSILGTTRQSAWERFSDHQ